MGRAELNLHVLSQSRRKSFFQGREFCLSAHSVIAPRARGGRVTPVGRTRLGRRAVEPRARGDDNQGGRNDFLRFQEQLLRRKKQKLFLGVSVGNGVRGGITLQAKNPRNNFGHVFFAHESHESTRSVFNGLIMATCSVARIFTNSMRVMLFYDDNSNFTNLTNSLILFV